MRIIDHKPVLFEKSGHNIWTDPYIQQQILKEHLDPQSDGASRKRESVLKIVDFILQHTKPQSHLLDLGCGPGLYTSLLADKDYMVTGIDFNKASIEYAIGKREEINYILGDYINNYPMGKYDIITMIYCDMGTHPDSDRDRLYIFRWLMEAFSFLIFSRKGLLMTDRKAGIGNMPLAVGSGMKVNIYF